MEFPHCSESDESISNLLGDILFFFELLKETVVSKQWRVWSDALFCGVWSGFALFAEVPQKEHQAYIG